MTAIVKLGGAQAGAPTLLPWLAAIEKAAGQVVVVPGGGPFADAVRAAQPVIGFDDVAAHDMALLAMEQFGRALCSLSRTLVMAADAHAIGAALTAMRVPVWAPAHMLDGAELPRSWDVTSDTLALWLAIRLGADALILIKRASEGEGLVDPEFAALQSSFAGTVRIAGPEDLPEPGGSILDGPGREMMLA